MKILFILDHATFGDDFLSIASAAAPYCDIIRYRAKRLSTTQIYKNAARLRDSCPDSVLWLSDYADMATILGYDGLSVGANSMPISAIKAAFPALTVCYAAHTLQECALAADYFTLSPLFHTEKPYQINPLGAIAAPAPNVYALGGISAKTILLLRGLGYEGVAGISFYKDLAKIRELALYI